MDQYNEPPKIVFENENFQRSSPSLQTPTPKIIQLVMQYSRGIIKDKKQANYVLIGFVVLAIIISFILVFGGGNTQNTFTPPADAPASQVIRPAEF